MTDKQKKFLHTVGKCPDKFPQKDLHYWVDYLELLCLVNIDGTISLREYRDRLQDASPDGETTIIDESSYDSKSEKNDKIDIRLNDIFTVVSFREKTLGEVYPFELSQDQQVIQIKPKSESQELYFFLLFCSCLYACETYKSPLTSSFELLCLDAFPHLLPKNAVHYLFGSSNIHTASSSRPNLIEGNFATKINKLAELISERVHPIADVQLTGNNGDGGLDIVGFFKFGDNDNTPNLLLCFGQCGCTPDWVNKQFSTHYDTWSNYITLQTNPNSFIFIPYFFRDSSGNWHNSSSIKRTILIDRMRLIYLLVNESYNFSQLEGYDVLQELLSCREQEKVV